MSKVLHWLGRAFLVAAYSGLVVTLAVLASYLTFTRFVRSGSIPVPDVVGMERVEAQTLLEEAGLRERHRGSEDRYDEAIPAGHVLQQEPDAGTLVKRNGAVAVILSRGRRLVAVPDLRGRDLQAAVTELAAAGLQPGRRGSVYWSGAEPGTVVLQEPAAGLEADRSSEVHLLVSSSDPAAKYVMPDLVARRAESVRSFFEARGFRIGSVKYEPYEGVEEGVVLRHTPQAGHPLRRRDAITLVVSTAASPTGS